MNSPGWASYSAVVGSMTEATRRPGLPGSLLAGMLRTMCSFGAIYTHNLIASITVEP